MKKTLIIVILTALSFGAFAQQIKLGHINSAELMRQMPEVDSADLILQRQSREIEADMRTMFTEYENALSEFQANQNQMSDLIRQTRIARLQDMQNRLQEFEQNARRSLDELQSALFNPIIEKARAAIGEVAKENRFTYVFDSSGGMLLYFSDSEDIMNLVKRKLNLR